MIRRQALEFPDNQPLLHKGMRLRTKRNGKVSDYWIIERKRLNKVWVVEDVTRPLKRIRSIFE